PLTNLSRPYLHDALPFGGSLRYPILSDDCAPVTDPPPGTPAYLAFYRDDYVMHLDRDGEPLPSRADFVRDDTGQVRWLRIGGRLHRKTACRHDICGQPRLPDAAPGRR